MQERIKAELALIQQALPDVDYRDEDRWVRVPSYPLPKGWNRTATDVAFQVGEGYPGTPPYGFYVPSGIQFHGVNPDDYTEPAANQPPFGGTWGFFSWAPVDGLWQSTADAHRGSNLLHWVRGFADRFKEGA